MTSTIPLATYPGRPVGKDLAMLKEAKAKLNIDAMIQPVRALPGSPGRIIALREKPNWICDYAFIPNPNVDSLKEALQWVLGIKEDPRGITVIRTLREIFGRGVQELPAAVQFAEQGETK